jgi:tetratricopeptide (TPR) repeat protein
MRLGPGTPATGFLIAALAAFLAQARVLGCGLVWDDVVLLARDVRIRDASFAWTCFADSFFGPLAANEMYRPVVNASLALDWHLSGSTPEHVRAWWFHIVNLGLHAANAGLLFLVLGTLTRRFLGAPLLAAVLFAAHPLCTETTAWIVGRCDLLAAFFGLASTLLLLRSPGDRRLIAPAVVLYGLALYAKASAAFLPVVVMLGLVAYHGVPPGRLFGRRLLRRFAWFALPAAAWLVSRALVLGAPFPRAGGLRWHHVGALDGLRGVGRALTVYLGQVFVPARLSGDYLADPAFSPGSRGIGLEAWLGLALALAALALGLRYLRRYPRVAFPLVAGLVLLLPSLQVVRIGAIFADRFLYLPLGFFLLLVGEGLERAFLRGAPRAAVPLAFLLVGMLATLSLARAPAWDDDVTFNRDVLRVFPGARQANLRLAGALAERGGPGDRQEALGRLNWATMKLRRPDEEHRLLGALLIEEGAFDEAERRLREGIGLAGDKPQLGADMRYNLAVVLAATGRNEEAVRFLREALDRYARHEPSRRMLQRLENEGR